MTREHNAIAFCLGLVAVGIAAAWTFNWIVSVTQEEIEQFWGNK
jgi:hypothetical protein